LQILVDRGELQRKHLPPAAETIRKLKAKGWIEITESATYRVTAAGIAAMKAKI
jgi:hypothetical protein